MSPTWSEVALAVVNAAQLCLLAWIASRGARRRRQDQGAGNEDASRPEQGTGQATRTLAE